LTGTKYVCMIIAENEGMKYMFEFPLTGLVLLVAGLVLVVDVLVRRPAESVGIEAIK